MDMSGLTGTQRDDPLCAVPMPNHIRAAEGAPMEVLRRTAAHPAQPVTTHTSKGADP